MNKQITQYLESPLLVGQTVRVKGFNTTDPSEYGAPVEIIGLTDVEGQVIVTRYGKPFIIDAPDYTRVTDHIGHNPFVKTRRPRRLHLSLENVLEYFGISIGLGNPAVCVKTNHLSIQGIQVPEYNSSPYLSFTDREGIVVTIPVVHHWSLAQKQAMISSIFKEQPLGNIYVRKWDYFAIQDKVRSQDILGLAVKDILDGHQRIHTLLAYIQDDFRDRDGMLYSDLSVQAQQRMLKLDLLTIVELHDQTPAWEYLDVYTSLHRQTEIEIREHFPAIPASLGYHLNPVFII